MREFLLRIIGKPLRLSVKWYTSKTRIYRYQNIKISIPTGVFHPGLFFSTKYILRFLRKQNLRNEKFLELGSGSGLISIVASKMGAQVTACDISEKAVSATMANAKANAVTVQAIQSNLFDNLMLTKYDWIVVNPPYYPSNPKNEDECAWYCGSEHEYFKKFFGQLTNYIHGKSHILIVLSDVCNLNIIFSIAKTHNLYLEKISEKNIFTDGKNYLFWIKENVTESRKTIHYH